MVGDHGTDRRDRAGLYVDHFFAFTILLPSYGYVQGMNGDGLLISLDGSNMLWRSDVRDKLR